MKIRAIYLPDLAFEPCDGNLIFEYDKQTKRFHMCIDPEFMYDVQAILEDNNWIVFETELCKDENSIQYGITNIISKENLLKRIGEVI